MDAPNEKPMVLMRHTTKAMLATVRLRELLGTASNEEAVAFAVNVTAQIFEQLREHPDSRVILEGADGNIIGLRYQGVPLAEYSGGILKSRGR